MAGQRDGRNRRAGGGSLERAIGTTKVASVEVVTDRAPTYPQRRGRVLASVSWDTFRSRLGPRRSMSPVTRCDNDD
jgi:hypothetical protein